MRISDWEFRRVLFRSLAQPVAVRDPDGRRAGVGAGAGAVAGAQAVRRGARAMSGLDLLGVLLLLGFGAGVLAVAWQGWKAGAQPGGSSIFGEIGRAS